MKNWPVSQHNNMVCFDALSKWHTWGTVVQINKLLFSANSASVLLNPCQYQFLLHFLEWLPGNKRKKTRTRKTFNPKLTYQNLPQPTLLDEDVNEGKEERDEEQQDEEQQDEEQQDEDSSDGAEEVKKVTPKDCLTALLTIRTYCLQQQFNFSVYEALKQIENCCKGYDAQSAITHNRFLQEMKHSLDYTNDSQ